MNNIRTEEVTIGNLCNDGPTVVVSNKTGEVVAIDNHSLYYSFIDLIEFGSLCMCNPDGDINKILKNFENYRLKQPK
jgi:hypothetical protein